MEGETDRTQGAVTPGEWLAQARTQRGLTQQQAAEGLNLDVWVVEAIESNRFAALGAPVYAKGHLRKYALLLGLPAEEVLARYEHLNDTPTVQDPIPATVAAPIRDVRSQARQSVRVVGAIVAVGVLIAIAFAVFQSVGSSSADNGDETQASPPVPAPSEAATSDVPATAAPAPAEVSAVPPAATSSAATDAAVTPTSHATQPMTNTAQEPNVTIRLQFTETCWTEVYDASGKRLMFDNGTAGRVRTLSGQAPLRVTLGMASAVKLEVDGKQAVIPRRSNRESARFSVGADGSVSEG
ncbi:MAG TPA: RodZ domain-containing protein [Steroidobacteraceae bacterium]|nr:RodZ domain-containing protein [Steroidobacteraceae bacterium]